MAEEKEVDVVLSEQETWDIIRFFNAFNNTDGVYTPSLINQTLKDLNLNPRQASESELNEAMRNPKDNEDILRAFSQDFELSSMVYKRLINYLSNMLAFDLTYTSTNAKNNEYGKPRYTSDVEKVEDFLNEFNYRQEFTIAVKEMLRNDAYFGCIRRTKTKWLLQELPLDYCKITGKWEGGFTFDFNMEYFLQAGVDIDLYPSFFKRKYKEIWGGDKAPVNKRNGLSNRLAGKSRWGMWVSVPSNLGVCFKLSPEIATRLPYFTPLFKDLVLQDLTRNLQKNANAAAASKMIIGEVPLLQKDVKATVKDTIAISPELLGKFMALMRSALDDSIKVASAPLQEIEAVSFDSEPDIYDGFLRTTLASSGVNTNLIFSSSVKPNAIETQLSLNVDEQMMTNLYDQFNVYISHVINGLTTKYKFAIEFEGTDFSVNREARLDRALKLFNAGFFLPQKIAAAMGMKPATFRKHLQEAKADDYMSLLSPPSVEQARQMLKYTPDPVAPASATKTTGDTEDKKKGRPQKKVTEISEEGQKTRETGANVARGGKV